MIRLITRPMKRPAVICAILAPLSMLLEVFMDLQQPAMMSNIVDIGVANGDLSYIMSMGGRMVCFALLGLVGGAGCTILSNYTAIHTAGNIRKGLFVKIQRLSFAEIDKLETSSLITRTTNDVTQIENMISGILRGLSRAPMLCIGGIIMSFMLDARLALILCVSLPIIAVAAYFIISRTIPLFAGVQERIDGVNTVMRESLLGTRVVKAFTLEERQFDRFSQSNDALTNHSIKAQSATFLLMPIVTLVMNLSIVAVLWFGGNMEIAGSLPAGKIIAFVNYMIQITNAMMMLVNFIAGISRAQASARRIEEVFDVEPSVQPPLNPKMPTGADIEFDHVSFRYGTGEQVLKDVSFTLREGHRVGIIGATGCGKSTLAALIARLYDVSSGAIKIGGVDVREIAPEVLRAKVGVVLQESLLFSGSISDNLRYGDKNAKGDTLALAVADAQAEPFISELPEGVESRVEQRGKNFSGGQKQRLSIARTLLQNPEILIMDDSTSAVDLSTEAQLQAAIRRRVSGTLILIAQRISSIMDCDVILVMDEGGISAMGRHGELMRTSELYRAIAVSQLGEDVEKYAG